MAMFRLGETAHFSVQYEQTSLPALAIAQAILAIAETNFNSLNVLLPIPANEKTPGGLPPFTGLAPIIVEVLATPSGSLGVNFGYDRVGRSRIQVSKALTPEAGQQAFAAELAEIFMGFYRWNSGDSQGEALSIVCRDELYSAPDDIRVNAWLDGGRPNRIDEAAPTDVDAISFGCGILFINYLCYQLGHPMSTICQAPGTTLADRHRALEKTADGGFSKFSALLEKHLPSANGPAALKTDNPFPLFDEASRRSIIPSFQRHTRLRVPLHLRHHSKVHVSPFFTCPLKDYAVQLVAYADTVEVEVQVVGFAKPVFEWRVGGLPLPLPSGRSTATVELETPIPTRPAEPQHSRAPLTFDYSASDQFLTRSMSSILTLSNVDFGGTYTLDIELSVTEAEADFGATTLPLQVRFKTLEAVYEAAFYADGHRCEREFERSALPPELGAALRRLKSLPDPPPPDARGIVVEAVLAAQASLLQARSRHAAEPLVTYAAALLQVNPRVFASTLELLERQESYEGRAAT